MQLLQALLALAVLPAALARATSHERLHAVRDAEPEYRPEEDLDMHELQARGLKPRCSKRGAHIVVLSGHGAPNIGGFGLLNTTSNAVAAAIPFSNVWSMPFDKQNPDLVAGIATGVVNLTNHLPWYTSGCPNTPIILMGYSQGGIVTLNTLCGKSSKSGWTDPVSPAYAPYIAATILYGEETRVPNQPYLAGTCTTGSGVNPRQNPAGCAAYQSTFKSWCDENDPQCCATQLTTPGGNQSVHYIYPAEYDQDAVAWAVQGFQNWKAAHKAVPAPITTTGTPPAPSTTPTTPTTPSPSDILPPPVPSTSPTTGQTFPTLVIPKLSDYPSFSDWVAATKAAVAAWWTAYKAARGW